MDHHGIVTIDDYEKHIGAEAVARIKSKARPLQQCRVVNVNSTYYGGGVSMLLGSLTLLMNSLGIETGWRTIHGPPDFFSVTKKMHNALQSGDINWSPRKQEIYEAVVYQNSILNHLTHDIVVVHDPQPLPLVTHYRKGGPWVWRCHIDLQDPHRELWNYLAQFIEQYDAVIMSSKEYAQPLKTPQVFFMPAIDPFSIVNDEMTEAQCEERLEHYGIPSDLPLVVQISRFDRWKDPQGVIDAFNLARQEVPCRLVLLGNVATDDPEGPQVYESLLSQQTDEILIMSQQDGALVNALQRKAAVVLQKSLREGFGLTVSEAMWKGTPVIGGNVGGIKLQIEDGVSGYLVSSVEEAAARIVELVKYPEKGREMGVKAREVVRQKFLLSRYLEQYLDLFNSFETVYKLNMP
ncbi:MAG: glycosyltransferase [Dehalococcoidia bacterium]|nr:glycosyltransferase [Dehalococcoidia bacterium]